MINILLSQRVNEWFAQPDCACRSVVEYIERRGQLREAQIEAIKTYLFLKLEGGNKPLWELFCSGFFTRGDDLRLNFLWRDLPIPLCVLRGHGIPAVSEKAFMGSYVPSGGT